jgi:pimeloyl-ACP methyl ester carboxylesterase
MYIEVTPKPPRDSTIHRTTIDLTRYDRHMQLADGRRLGYAEYGDPHGKPIVYFHGGLSSRLDAAWLHDAARTTKTRLLSVDRPGIGLSDRQPGRNLIDWAADVRQFASKLGISQFPVLGWSCGAFYVLACAHELSDIVTKAGTVGAVAPPDEQTIIELGMVEDRILFTCPDFLRPLLSVGVGAMKLMPPNAVKRQLLDKLKCQSDIDIVNRMTDEEASGFFFECVRNGGTGGVEDYHACKLPWRFRVEDIKTQTLMWHGSEDNLAPASSAMRLASQMPGVATFIDVQDSGHFLLCEKAESIFAELLS